MTETNSVRTRFNGSHKCLYAPYLFLVRLIIQHTHVVGLLLVELDAPVLYASVIESFSAALRDKREQQPPTVNAQHHCVQLSEA